MTAMSFNAKEKLDYSIITDTDSYKWSHSCGPVYPPNTTYMMSYFESRGGELDICTLFGLQYIMNEYLTKKVTLDMVEEAARFAPAHGEPFNKEGWTYIVEKHNGKLPVRIRAIPEGTVVPVSNAILTIESTDPEVFWIVSWLETMLVRLWYPSTIATTSRESKKIVKKYLELTSDTPEADLPFKVHDFGARGVATLEQSRLGGAAHLLSFLGSDTIEGIRCANHYYDCDMAGFSIPATEHSIHTMWGKEKEFDSFKNYIKKYLTEREVPEGMPKLAACVSDSYNIFEAVKFWCRPDIVQLIKESNGTIVIRPDSGAPLEILSKVFNLLGELLSDEITVNKKGYKVLPDTHRIIQGDGIDRKMMESILKMLWYNGWSTTNIAFGSGGGLLQKVNRDTQRWAFKCCAAEVDGKEIDVRKDPITDPGKQSKGGRLDLIMKDNEYKTVALEKNQLNHPDSAMNVVFENGDIKYHTTFDECRKRMDIV